MRERLFTVLKILFSLALVALAFILVDIRRVAAQLANARPGYFVLALVFYLIAIAVNGAKWQVLLRAQGIRVPYRAVLRFMFVGFFFNNFLPMLGGDVMRGFSLARYTDRTAGAAVSVVVDRIIGLIAYMSSAVLAAFITVILLRRQDLQWLEGVALAAFSALALGLAVLLSRRLRMLISRVFAWRWLNPLAGTWKRVSDAFNAYRFRADALALAFLVALLGILFTTLVNWLLSQSMGGLMWLPYIFLLNPLIALLQTVPISVGGGLGVNQAAYPFFFGLVGVPVDHAVAVSLLMQAVVFLGSLPGGFLWFQGRARRPAHETAK
ncbi:MAG: hypothetical protein BWY52_03107 [Chloroflexi bacterium ADurb.Bin325]|nr:MAG: hypothetical protein BWY52_03107 [Chloroflexi bacterium ADurb.Bin325]